MTTHLEKLQSYRRESARVQAEAVPIPPFTVFFHATDRSLSANFAIPDMPLRSDVSEPIHRVEIVFAARECRPRIQFLYDYAPDLPQSLRDCGYDEVESTPIFVCTPQSFRPAQAVAGLEMVTLSRDSSLEDIREGWNTNSLGFDPNGELATDEQVESFRQGLEDNLGFTARLDGQAVGAGMFNPVRNGVTDLVGVTTLAAFRRRGIASYLSAFATQAAFDLGVEMVFLVPENAEAQRVYERIGYELVTVQLSYQAKA